jgi:hypothetical protein
MEKISKFNEFMVSETADKIRDAILIVIIVIVITVSILSIFN